MEKEIPSQINKQCILITGGCGYIGSHTSLLILQKSKSFYPVILDFNIKQNSSKVLIENGIEIFEGNINDKEILRKIQEKHKIIAVMQFAAYIEAGESVTNPKKYFENNVNNFEKFLEGIRELKTVKNIIYSSSAAVYGVHTTSIKEDFDKKPVNPYGETKLQGEKILEKFSLENEVKSIALRYFNAAGCIENGVIGEEHEPETHLIPRLIQNILNDKPVSVFGNDYPTKDGTCVRDYIHVLDLADGHLKALELISNSIEKSSFDYFNLGSGKGYSILEVIENLQLVINENEKNELKNYKIQINYEGRREGDPAFLVASTEKAEKVLKVKLNYNLKQILKSAFNFFLKKKQLN